MPGASSSGGSSAEEDAADEARFGKVAVAPPWPVAANYAEALMENGWDVALAIDAIRSPQKGELRFKADERTWRRTTFSAHHHSH